MMFEKLDNLLNEYLKLGVPGCDCIVYHKGKCVYRKYVGYSDKEEKIEMAGTELYNIYSCSKVITCTAALMLCEAGKLKLEDKLSKYFPEFETMLIKTEEGLKEAEKSIKIKDLFCMTAGFTYDVHSPELEKCRAETKGQCALREVMPYLAKEALAFEPGAQFQYSLCHDVLAAVVEAVSGEAFGKFVQEHIFKSLNMKRATYRMDDEELEQVIPQYFYDPEEKCVKRRSKTNDLKLGTAYESGGAGCITTVEDYMKFLEGLRTGKLLSEETLKQMITNQIPDDKRGNYWMDGYGYGLGVRCPKDDPKKNDFGWGGAAGAYALIDLDKELSLFYAQHVLNFYDDSLRERLYFAVCEDMKL